MKKLVSFYDGTFDETEFDKQMLACESHDGLMSKEDKVKLDKLSGESGKLNPVTAKDIVVDAEHCFVTDEQKAAWTAKPENKEDIGLSNVTNDAQVKRSEMGVAGGVATLDDSGLIPSAFLPGFVDDVIEADTIDKFPAEGESGKIYVSTSENKSYRWSGSGYVEIAAGLALGETSATAYAGDKGKAVADAVDAIIFGTTVVPKATDASTVSGFAVKKTVPADAVFTDTVYTHPDTHPATMIVEDADHKFATEAELAKVDAIPEDPKYTDTIYTHPDTHPATMIVEDETHKFVSDEQIATWDAKANEIHRVPYYDAAQNSVFGCGVGITIDDSETDGKIKISWNDEKGVKYLEVPEYTTIIGGGYGETEPVYYPTSSITMNSGKVHSIFGGNLSNGTVGCATIVMNGGTLKDGITGGGCCFNSTTKKSAMNTVGHVEIIVNNSDSEILIVYGGGQGFSTVGSVKTTINGGSINYLTAGGSNGHTSVGNVIVNGGSIKVLQGCNRGTMANIKLDINGGTIGKVYAGGEIGDSSVTATYVKSEVYVSGGTISHIYDGTNGGVEDASKVSGTYVDGIVTDEEASKLNLSKVTTLEKVATGLIDIAMLEGKTLVLKHGDTVIASVDLSSIVA